MTAATTTPPEDEFDHRRVQTVAWPLLGDFNRAGVLEAADVHVATRLCVLAEETDPRVALALALTVRALRAGSVCVDLDGVAADAALPDLPDLPWPDVAEWRSVVAGSSLLREPAVLRLDEDGLLYLDRYWREEQEVCADLLARPPETEEPKPDADLSAALDRVFPADGYDEQRAAARVALARRTTVLTGGPGTGKTTTVAALLALLTEREERAGRRRPRIALAAPTGKAAARLQQAVEAGLAGLGEDDRRRVAGVRSVTLHRLLGSRPDTSTRFRHHRGNPLPHDVIVVDETSMVSLSMMARLLEAVRPDTRLVLVGDPDQLTSVEAGAVLADVVEGLGAVPDAGIAALTTSHRFGDAIGALATAVREGDAESVLELLRAGDDHVVFHADGRAEEHLRARVVPHALALRRAAQEGDVPAALAALDGQRLLCAHREGPAGVRRWNAQVERWVAEETGEPGWSTWYAGRPVLVTANDYGLGVYNGDTGVAYRRADGVLRVAVSSATGAPVDLATSRLGEAETMHALTIHKSQGSQADEVLVVLPPADSRLLTRELLYTALTRAQRRVVVVGTEEEVTAAVRRRARRATGLARRLRRGAAVE